MKKSILALTLACSFAMAGVARAQQWKNHAAPYDYLFGNNVDTHQETKLKLNKDGTVKELIGSLFITFTDASGTPIGTTSDGLPIGRHPRASMGEICGETVECVAAWKISAVQASAKFLFHTGVNGDDHATWLQNRAEQSGPPISGVPQPGSFLHFHWISNDEGAPTQATDPRASTIPSGCNAQRASDLEPDAVDESCPGWLIELRAVRGFAFEHGGEFIPVKAGIDNATHLNILTNYNGGLIISQTR